MSCPEPAPDRHPPIPVAILRYDRSNRIRYASPGAWAIFGVDPDRLFGSTIEQIGRGTWCDGWGLAVADVFAKGEPRVLACLMRRGTKVRRYESVLLPEFFPSEWVGSVLELVYDCSGLTPGAEYPAVASGP